MTQNSAADIASEIEALRSDLAKVQAAIPIVGKAAATKAQDISKAIDDAKERYAAAMADEVLAARKARLAKFSDMTVSYPDDGRGLLKIPFTIRYTKPAYDSVKKATVPKLFKVDGFNNLRLSGDAWDYLMSDRPDAIPPQIMALAPGDPVAAMDRYFIGLKRGSIRH